MNDRRGCLGGLLELFLLTSLVNWLERRFGFGKGCSCAGIGCGFIILIVFLCALCSIVFGVDWTQLRF
jgi:apolipoprotein N-acyltransferase